MNFDRTIFQECVSEAEASYDFDYVEIPRNKVKSVLDKVDPYPNYERTNIEKYFSYYDPEMECVGLFLGDKCVAIAVIKHMDEGFTFVHQLNSFRKGSGARLLRDIIADHGKTALGANPEGGEKLLQFYRRPEFNFREITVTDEGGGEHRFFATPDCEDEARKLFEYWFPPKKQTDEADSDIGGDKSDIGDEIKPGKKIWIDDVREAPEGYIWLKSVREFIDYCHENGIDDIELFDTDHDAGDFQAQGGDYIRCFDYLEANGCRNITIHIHSANPVGANNIRRIITRNKELGWREIRNTDEADEMGYEPGYLEETEPQDITESIHLDLNDENIEKADCRLIAYNVHVDECDDVEAYNPKTNPDKAVDIVLDYPGNSVKVEIFLDTKTGEWDSRVNDGTGRLSPEQMEQFFGTDFFGRMKNRLMQVWPCEDPFFAKLVEAIQKKRLCIGDVCGEEVVDEESGANQFGTGKADIAKSREKNVAGKQIRTRSGRKYITPSDFAVKHSDQEKYFCWPENGKEFKWSQWADWKKIKPLCRMRWEMGTMSPHVYGISLSPLLESNENRGFRGYDLTAQPPLQYLTPEETQMVMDLSIVKKFLKNVTRRIQKFLDYSDVELMDKIGRPDKCTIEDIRQTKRHIRYALEAIKNRRADTYIYTD